MLSQILIAMILNTKKIPISLLRRNNSSRVCKLITKFRKGPMEGLRSSSPQLSQIMITVNPKGSWISLLKRKFFPWQDSQKIWKKKKNVSWVQQILELEGRKAMGRSTFIKNKQSRIFKLEALPSQLRAREVKVNKIAEDNKQRNRGHKKDLQD